MIRRSRASDREWIRDTAALVYRELGDYRSIIPSWLLHPGVLAYVDEDQGVSRGFLLLGFYTQAAADAGDDTRYVADLLAIGVAPEHQRGGVGRALLAHALATARAAAGHEPIPEIRLTVAETNAAARALFRGAGFEVIDGAYGHYDGGQRALRMRRGL